MDKRVVITGMGCVTPIGTNKETTWQNAIKGVSGIQCISDELTEDLPVKLAAEISGFDPSLFMEAKENQKNRPVRPACDCSNR